ncbi:MAG: hypothetical protein AAB381_00850 [Patescibacteria group bacterium]
MKISLLPATYVGWRSFNRRTLCYAVLSAFVLLGFWERRNHETGEILGKVTLGHFGIPRIFDAFGIFLLVFLFVVTSRLMLYAVTTANKPDSKHPSIAPFRIMQRLLVYIAFPVLAASSLINTFIMQDVLKMLVAEVFWVVSMLLLYLFLELLMFFIRRGACMKDSLPK